MYVCAYVRTYVRTYVCMYVCMYLCMYLCMYTCLYVCIDIYVWRPKVWGLCMILGSSKRPINKDPVPLPGAEGRTRGLFGRHRHGRGLKIASTRSRSSYRRLLHEALHMYTYVDICMCMRVNIYIYIYMYMYTVYSVFWCIFIAIYV